MDTTKLKEIIASDTQGVLTEITPLEKLIYSMLTESTGRALCDSGGNGGRNWERNQLKTIEDFLNEKPIEFDGSVYDGEFEIYPEVSLFHYLTNGADDTCFGLDDICDKFNSKAGEWSDNETVTYGMSDKQQEFLDSMEYKAGDTWNTYNGESFLSQTLQGVNIEIDGEEYTIFQIHNGCDVRGGYTDAKMIKNGKYQEGGINPCPYAGMEYKGVEYDTGYNGYSMADDNGNAPKGTEKELEKLLKELNK